MTNSSGVLDTSGDKAPSTDNFAKFHPAMLFVIPISTHSPRFRNIAPAFHEIVPNLAVMTDACSVTSGFSPHHDMPNHHGVHSQRAFLSANETMCQQFLPLVTLPKYPGLYIGGSPHQLLSVAVWVHPPTLKIFLLLYRWGRQFDWGHRGFLLPMLPLAGVSVPKDVKLHQLLAR